MLIPYCHVFWFFKRHWNLDFYEKCPDFKIIVRNHQHAGASSQFETSLPNIPVDPGSLISVTRHWAFLSCSLFFSFYQFLTRRVPRDATNCFQEKVGFESHEDGGWDMVQGAISLLHFHVFLKTFSWSPLIMGNDKHGPNPSSFGFPLVSWWWLFCHLGLI